MSWPEINKIEGGRTFDSHRPRLAWARLEVGLDYQTDLVLRWGSGSMWIEELKQ